MAAMMAQRYSVQGRLEDGTWQHIRAVSIVDEAAMFAAQRSRLGMLVYRVVDIEMDRVLFHTGPGDTCSA